MAKSHSAQKTALNRRPKGRPKSPRSQRQKRGRRRRKRSSKRWRPDSKHTAPVYRRALRRVIERAYRPLLHAKQTLSLFMICYGIIWSDRLGVAAVGTAMSRAFGKTPKHGIKQVDRCLSNEKLDLQKLYQGYVPFVVGQRRSIAVNLDWTEFDQDDHSTVSLSLVTRGKRAIPLVWMTVVKSTRKGRMRKYERQILRMLATSLPKNIDVLILADRGFGDVKLYRYIKKTLGFDFVIRFKPNIHVEREGCLYPAGELVPRNGRVRVLRDTKITAKRMGPYTVVLTKAAGMKEPWCLATSLSEAEGKKVVTWYSRRFQCEEAFRDLKDRRYGYGLRFTRISDCRRRDRFLLLFSLAYLIQTLMGVSSEKLGLDRQLRANTVKERTHSLFRQGRSLLGELARETYAALSATFAAILRSLLAKGMIDALA